MHPALAVKSLITLLLSCGAMCLRAIEPHHAHVVTRVVTSVLGSGFTVARVLVRTLPPTVLMPSVLLFLLVLSAPVTLGLVLLVHRREPS